jgi:hypothetical protein
VSRVCRPTPSAVFRTTTTAVLMLWFVGDASAQQRRRIEEPPPEPLPVIADDTAKCSFAYHEALQRLNVKPLATFEKVARLTEPGLNGRWLYWTKGGKGAQKAPPPERVCAESVVRAGRERCLRFALKPVDPAIAALAASQPSTEELAVLRAIDGFVVDKGAALEFGSNGRQFATLQRVAAELGGYSTQPRHPALCNGVPEMMEFKVEKLSGVRKRAADVAALAAKSATLARQRVIAARDQRVAAAKAAVTAAAAAVAANVAPAPAAEGQPVAPAAPVVPVPEPKAAMPAKSDAQALLVALLDGLLTPAQSTSLDGEATALRKLQRARELLTRDGGPALPQALRASTGAALRMVEAAAYGELQVTRVRTFEGIFLGTVDGIRDAHRSNCTCGS